MCATRTRAARARAPALEFKLSPMRRLGVGLIACDVAIVPVVFDHSLDVPFTVPKALLTHALAYALAAVIGALAIRFGRGAFSFSWSHVPVLVFLLVTTLATGLSSDKALALYGTHARMLGLGTLAAWVVLYFATATLILTRREAIVVLCSLCAGAMVVLAYELIQLLGWDPLSWTLDSAERPFSTIGQPTVLAQYLTTLALGVSGVAVFAADLEWRLRAGALTLSALMVLGAAVTGTRSAIIGLVAGTVMLATAAWVAHPTRTARMLSISIGVLATVILAALVAFTPLGSRIAAVVDTPNSGDDDALARLEPSLAGRVALYAIAAQEFRERPLFGYGPDSFVVGVPKFRSMDEPREIQQSLATSPHSWIAFVMTSSGLAGLAAFVATTIMAFRLALGAAHRPVTIAAAVALATFLGTGLTTVTDVSAE